jgi:hypothetical protein
MNTEQVDTESKITELARLKRLYENSVAQVCHEF